MDKNKIAKAARQISEKVVDANGFDDSKPTHLAFLEGHIDGFNAGAKWMQEEFFKDLWHSNTEEPDKSKSDIITLGFDNDAYLQFLESILWREESWRHSISRCQIIKWAYLSDILPEQEGGENENRDVPVCVKTEYVDGVNIKADTWYQLKNEKFVEVTE